MFRRRWSGLPEDPDFPVDLEKLGYFIQPETDEIRSLTNPSFYFHYFRTKNDRHNDRQRFAFNRAVQEIIHARLEALGMTKIALPVPATPSPKPVGGGSSDVEGAQRRHVPLFISKDLHTTDHTPGRVVVLFGEATQALGVLAHRVIGGQGGVDKGSVVSLVKALLSRGSHGGRDRAEKENGDGGEGSSTTTMGAGAGTGVGVVLANTGERWWWPQGQRPLCHRDSMGVKMKSAVHKVGSFDPAVNLIPGSENVEAHVKSVFESVLGNANNDGKGSVIPSARIQIIAVGEAAAAVETYLDENWGRWKGQVDCLAMLGDGKPCYELKDEGFKQFLRERARIYITTQAPLNTPLANSEGNPKTMNFTSYGCPVLSSGEPYYVELTLIKAKDAVLAFLDDVYQAGRDSGAGGHGSAYVNPIFEITYTEEDLAEETPAWGMSEADMAGIQNAGFAVSHSSEVGSGNMDDGADEELVVHD